MENQSIVSKIDYLTEATRLLNMLAKGETEENLVQTLLVKYELKSEAVKKQIKLIGRIVNRAYKTLHSDMEEVKLYYNSWNDSDTHFLCLADLVLLRDEMLYEDTLNEALEQIRRLPEEKRNHDFYAFLSDEDVEKHEGEIDELTVIRAIGALDLNVEQKWNIQQVFLNREEHVVQVEKLLKKAIALLEKYQEELTEQAQQFQTYWSNVLEQTYIFDYFHEKVGVSWLPSEKGLVIMPSIIAPNIVSISSQVPEDGNEKKADVIRIGIAFGDEFDFGREASDTGYELYAMQVMKLLSDKSKFDILRLIKNRRSYGAELARELGLTTATISHHMNALVSSSLVTIEREDGEKRIYYRTNQKKLRETLDYYSRILLDVEK